MVFIPEMIDNVTILGIAPLLNEGKALACGITFSAEFQHPNPNSLPFLPFNFFWALPFLLFYCFLFHLVNQIHIVNYQTVVKSSPLSVLLEHCFT